MIKALKGTPQSFIGGMLEGSYSMSDVNRSRFNPKVGPGGIEDDQANPLGAGKQPNG
jgi:hypothetical protein